MIVRTWSHSENKNCARAVIQAIMLSFLVFAIANKFLHSQNFIELPIRHDFLFEFLIALIENTCILVFFVPGFAVPEALWLAVTLCLGLLTQLSSIQDVDSPLIALLTSSIILFQFLFPLIRKKTISSDAIHAFDTNGSVV